LEILRDEQERWAGGLARWPGRSDYVSSLKDNLFRKALLPETEKEIDDADGSELKPRGSQPPKIQSLLSSSALAVNVFDYWRDKDWAPLNVALGTRSPIRSLRFEQKCQSYPVPPRSPNLDVMLEHEDGSRVAIESKFTEPYRPKSSSLSTRYFPAGRAFWADNGLKGAQNLADELRQRWEFLDAAQLLKHCLGLACDRSHGPTTLLCLWFDAGTREADAHRAELATFARAVDGDRIQFRSMTYQELFTNMRRTAKSQHGEYISYLARRYFSHTD